MAFGVSISGKKPVATVTVGSVTIPIYACPVTVTKPVVATVAKNGVVTETRTYQSFQLSHFEGARRVLQRRNTLERAKALAKEVATRLSRDGSRAAFLTEKDRRILILAQNALISSVELIAEMGAAFLCGQSGIAENIIENSAAYLSNWLEQLQNDKALIVQAAAQAQKAADFILGTKFDDAVAG